MLFDPYLAFYYVVVVAVDVAGVAAAADVDAGEQHEGSMALQLDHQHLLPRRGEVQLVKDEQVDSSFEDAANAGVVVAFES